LDNNGRGGKYSQIELMSEPWEIFAAIEERQIALAAETDEASRERLEDELFELGARAARLC